MKKFFSLLMVLVCTVMVQGQNCDIPLTPMVIQADDGSSYPQATEYLINKMRHLVSNHVGTTDLTNMQFGIVADYDIVDKHVIGGTPTKIIYELGLSLYIVDLKRERIFETCNQNLKGIGDNETKALINAFQKLNVNNTQIKNFILSGGKKIVDYYDDAYPKIIKSVKALASMNHFDEAIYNLMSIPECSKGYEVAMNELQIVYKQFVNHHCQENLAQARAAWLASPNSDGASVASVYLSEIYPDAACYEEAKELAIEISKKLGVEQKIMLQQLKDSMQLERQRIEAMRDIAIAYVTAQSKQKITNLFIKTKNNEYE